MSAMVPPVGPWLGRLLALARRDPVNLYIAGSAAGIVWIVVLGRLAYYNPLTNNRTSVWGMVSYNFIKPWSGPSQPADPPPPPPPACLLLPRGSRRQAGLGRCRTKRCARNVA